MYAIKVSRNGWVTERGHRIGFIAEVDGVGWYAWDEEGWEPLGGPWPERGDAIEFFERRTDD